MGIRILFNNLLERFNRLLEFLAQKIKGRRIVDFSPYEYLENIANLLAALSDLLFCLASPRERVGFVDYRSSTVLDVLMRL